MKGIENNASIQFSGGEEIKVIPIIKVIRNKDGRKGKAIFLFKNIDDYHKDLSNKLNKIVLKDTEGQIITKKIHLQRTDENKNSIEVTYDWLEDSDFRRFMRFAISYSKTNSINKKTGGS